jgi:hypothetical protein
MQRLPGIQQRQAQPASAAPAHPAAALQAIPRRAGAPPHHGPRPIPLPRPIPPAVAQPSTVTLRYHPIVLVPQLLLLLALLAVAVLASMLLHDARVLAGGALLALVALAEQIAAWRLFTVTIRYDRINVRRLRAIFIRQETYALPSFGGLTYEQGFVGRMWNTGTLIMALPGRTIRLRLLTPYSEIQRMLGW